MENFPRKCIKCKQADLPLKEFVYARSIGVESFKTVYIKVPVCEACEKDLLKYEKHKIYLNLKNIPFCIFLISTFLTIIWIIGIPTHYQMIFTALTVAIITGLIFLIALMIQLNLYVKSTGRISRYIKLKLNGSFKIKDLEYKREYDEFVFSNFMDQLIGPNETITCPKCNNRCKKGIDFCNVCGKDLREFNKTN